MSVRVERIGQFSLGWGESLVWDERRGRLYFVDCAASTLHWLEDGGEDLHTVGLPSMPTGLVPTTDETLVVALDDGLHRVDPDAGDSELIVAYPAEMGGRANDACADMAGRLITGTLNLNPGPGSAWRYSATEGWRLLDPDISNTNGPAAGVIDGAMTLIIGDTARHYYAYDYEDGDGEAGPRRIFGDTSQIEGSPDGAALDSTGGLWCALVGGGQLARFTAAGLDRVVPLPVANPTDVTFGGPRLDRLFVTSIGLGTPEDSLDGALLVVEGLGTVGRPEPRYSPG